MAKKKIDISKIKEREVSQKEIEENEKDSKIKTWLMYRLPIILDIILAVIYIPTAWNILLIPLVISFVFTLYGWDSHQRICEKCKKWNGTVMISSDNSVRKKKITKQNLIGKDKVKEKNELVNKVKTKCLNCGHIEEKEIVK
jgi:hypothetical protein